jgi:hypothetical protein
MNNTEKEWFICAESGVRFQLPNGAKCSICKRMVTAKHYLYVDMDPVCLKCRKQQVDKILASFKPAT